MKILLVWIVLALFADPAHAKTRNPMVTGLGIGLLHMLNSIEQHPAGCPHVRFCGCGVSVRVYGHPVRELYLASAWYKFPRASLAPGTVIVTPHHVSYVEAVNDGVPICYDPNSGGHLTRVHACMIGGTIVSPR
jgi:hypothetical protein